MRKNIFAGVHWVDQVSGGMHIPGAETIEWGSYKYLTESFMELTVCIEGGTDQKKNTTSLCGCCKKNW